MKNFLLLAALLYVAVLHSQNTISGVITDAQNQPLPGVSISIGELHKGTVSGADGTFSISNLPAISTMVNFSMIGFENQNIKTGIKGHTILNIVMQEVIHQMDEVIVSTSFNRLQSQNVMKVEHAGIASLRQKGVTSLAEGLATIPGVSQISTGASIGKPVIRGLSSNRVLVYSQGVRLENQQFGEEHGLGLNDSGIESVEVIKGPASLLYGSDALGGVLYFNPEKFADSGTSAADVNQRYFSNTLGSSTSAGARISSDNLKFLARGSYSQHADYKIPNGERVENTRFNETDFKTAVAFSKSSYSGIFRYNYNRLRLGIPRGGFSISTSAEPEFPRQAVDNHILSFHNSIFFKGSKMDIDLGYINNDRSEFEESSAPSLRMKLQTFNYDLKYHLAAIDKLETIVGIQGMNQQNLNFGGEYLIPDAVTNDFGIFATANYEWSSNAIQGGVRYDNRAISAQTMGVLNESGYFEAINRSFKSINAAIGYKTEPSEKSSVRVNLASGFRAPNLSELTSNGIHEGTNRYEIGNKDLKNEQNLQLDADIEYKESHFEFSVNGFVNRIGNYIYAEPTGENIENHPVFRYVQNEAVLFGGEAELHFHPHPLDWLHIESSFETVTGKKSDGDYLPLIPATGWTNTIRTEFSVGKWLSSGFAHTDLVSTFAQKLVSGAETSSSGYCLLNMAFGGKVNLGKYNFNISLNGTNVLDQRYVAHLSRLKPEGIPNQGRNVILMFSFAI
ncbi:MAG: TonB-dependent receptor [Flavobacterium sp.]|nr:MAG: TonB-dependent receptor [Flavobacterium sp.]